MTIDEMMDRITLGDSIKLMRFIPDNFVKVCVTSPPYYGYKNYQGIKQMFITDAFCVHVWRKFIRKGMTGGTKSKKVHTKGNDNFQSVEDEEQEICDTCGSWVGTFGLEPTPEMFVSHLMLFIDGIKRILSPSGSFWLNIKDSFIDKSLQLVPESILFAMKKSGWLIRNVVIWRKPNQFPENVKDRFQRDYEPFIFATKSEKYYFNEKYSSLAKQMDTEEGRFVTRCVWDINTEMTSGSHTATFPTELVEIPIDACSEEGDVVFDPFSGYGTVALVSRMMRRKFIAFEISKNYAMEANYRISRASTL